MTKTKTSTQIRAAAKARRRKQDPAARQVALLMRNSPLRTAQIASRAKLSYVTVENLLLGKTIKPHNKTLDAILKVLGYSRKITRNAQA